MSDVIVEKKNKTKRCPRGTRYVPSRDMCLPTEQALAIISEEKQRNKKNKTRKNTKRNQNKLDEKLPVEEEDVKEEPVEEEPVEEEDVKEEPAKEEPAKEEPSIIEQASTFFKSMTNTINDTVDSISEQSNNKISENNVVKETIQESDVTNLPSTPEVENPEEEEMVEDEEYKLSQEHDEENKDMFLREKEEYYDNSKEFPTFLYPRLDDPNFNEILASKQEFNDHQFPDKPSDDIQEASAKECEKEFELMPHQQFLKNFMSLDTPYNSVLLYHELGTGKTCSAIGITEEMREYMKQTGFLKKIMIIASPNVQDNFKKQLFDSSRLKQLKNGAWNLDTCVGNKLLKEINPTDIEGFSREQVIKAIKIIIRKYYRFMGYDSVALYSESDMKHMKRKEERQRKREGGVESFLEHVQEELPEILDLEPIKASDSEEIRQQKKKVISKLREKFDYRLIVVDEFHNMISRKDTSTKSSARILLQIVQFCKHTRLVLLSATPLYNSHNEIIWVTNIMNMNDKRAIISHSQVFDKNGDFVKEKKNKDGIVIQESGDDLLRRKLTGYVSYVRGENPYTFPYRIYPSTFAENSHVLSTYSYPSKQFNGAPIQETPVKYVLDNVYVNVLQPYQKKVYDVVVKQLSNEVENFDKKTSFNFQELTSPLSVLNMTYPNDSIVVDKNAEAPKATTPKYLYGKDGLYEIMNFDRVIQPVEQIRNFEYKPHILKKYGRVFEIDKIGKYSAKIESICNAIQNSTGIVLIYSRYLEGGLLPMALALEEMGFSRYSYSSHIRPFLKKKKEYLNPLTMKKKELKDEYVAKYAMITGTKLFSPNNELDLELIMNPDNKDGRHVKVVMISEAGSEGLDFKCIRQVHILEPWYNMSRIEQIIGRAVRNKSHCSLPLEQRNVEIYMHVCHTNNLFESADMYMYRLAESKAIQIGKITRIMKESAIDCLLNQNQNNFLETKMNSKLEIELSTNSKKINYKIGDKPFSSKCDYMEQCELTCKPQNILNKDVNKSTYNIRHIQQSKDGIVKRVRALYKDRAFYTLPELIKEIQTIHSYPIEEVYYTLSQFIKNKSEWVVYKNQIGYLIKKNDIYVFQPNDLKNPHASIYERTAPPYEKPEYGTIEFQNKTSSDKKAKKITKENNVIEPPVTLSESKKTNNKNTIMNNIAKSTEFEFVDNKKIPSALGTMVETKMITPTNTYDTFVRKLESDVEFWQQHVDEYYKKKENEKATKSRDMTHMGFRVYQIMKYFHGHDGNVLIIDMIYHILDLTMYAEKLNYVQTLFQKESDFEELPVTTYNGDVEKVIRTYYRNKMFYHSTKKYYTLCMAKAKKIMYMVFSENVWREATPLEKEDNELLTWMDSQFQKRDKILQKVRNELKNSYSDKSSIGFISVNKSGLEVDGYSFKLKNLLQIRNNLGASCDQGSREVTLDSLKSVKKYLGKEEEKYTIVADNIYVTVEEKEIRITKHHICLIFELFLRHIKTDVWFLTPEESIQTDITHLSIQTNKVGNDVVYDLVEKNKK